MTRQLDIINKTANSFKSITSIDLILSFPLNKDTIKSVLSKIHKQSGINNILTIIIGITLNTPVSFYHILIYRKITTHKE